MKRFALSLATISMLVAPLAPIKAASLSAGDLIKASGPAVYYYNADGKRYVFPNEKTYATWYADFSNVKTITDGELAAIQIGGNVTYRPGVKLVKLTTDPKVYAVDGSKTLRWVTTEALAQAFYGSNWAKNVDDLPDAFFADYETGAAIGATTDYDRINAMNGRPAIGSTIAAETTSSEMTVTKTKGTDFFIDLDANPTTGYAWTAAFDPAKFAQVSNVFTPSDPGLVGAGGVSRFTFTPLAAGTGDIVFSYARSFEPGVPPLERRTYHVNVAEPAAPEPEPTTPTVPGTFTLTPSKTQAQANESFDLLAETTYPSPVTKIELFVGDILYASCAGARTCSMSFTLPTVDLQDSYAFTAKFHTEMDGVVEAHATVQVVALPINDAILLTLEHPQLEPGQSAGIRVQLAAGLNASKIVINVDGMDRKTCSSNPQSCRFDDNIDGAVGTVHTVYAWVQTPQSLKFKSRTRGLPVAENDSPSITLSAVKDTILPTETAEIFASASDDDGVASIELSRNGMVLKTCSGPAVCSVITGPFNLPTGSTVTFEAKATDLLGAVSTTTGATVTIQ